MPAADVVIVGLGAAGGVAADVLTAAGLEVVALEAGPRLDASAAALDEIANSVHARLSEPKAKHEAPTWRFDADSEAGPSPWPILMVNAVGGTTVHYDAVSIRFTPETFRGLSHAVERHGAGAIPKGATLVDWPVSYDELEPFYDAVEYAIGVSGGPGNIFEGKRSRPFPMEPLRRTGWADLMSDAAKQLGWHPFAAPASINSREYDGRPSCTFCGFCKDNICHCDAKGAAHLNVIRRAEATGLLRIETGAHVLRVEVDREGRASGVTYLADGEERFVGAKVVLVGTFTYENTRLLLLSRSPAYPQGLSNNHGQVGRDYIAHYVPSVYGSFPGRRLNLFNGTGAQVTAVDDWNTGHFDHGDLDFVGGGMFVAGHEQTPIGFAKLPLPPGVPRWGAEWKAWMAANAPSVGTAYAQFDALPYETNVLDLDPTVRDPLGLPVVRVTHQVGEHEERAAAFLSDRLEEWLKAAGAAEIWRKPGRVEARHCYGGTRMGTDPDSSVVDAFGFSHEVPNLGLLGASTFPSAGGYNPTLTVQALSWRTAARLVDEWGTIAATP